MDSKREPTASERPPRIPTGFPVRRAWLEGYQKPDEEQESSGTVDRSGVPLFLLIYCSPALLLCFSHAAQDCFLPSAKMSGEAGIRTLETLAGLPVFKTGAIDRSATSPESALWA